MKDLGIYIDLDSMFDVKYALLNSMYPELARLITTDGSYFKRVCDDYEHKDFRFKVPWSYMSQFYNARNKLMLADAKPTSIMILLSSVINNLIEYAQNGEEFRDLKFIVNTYPYLLLESEQVNISYFIRQFFSKYCKFEFYYFKPKEVNSKWILDNDVEIMIMYNFLEWLELADRSILLSTLIDDVKVMCPKLLNFKTNLINLDASVNSVDWDMIAKTCKLFVDIEFLDIVHYAPFELIQKIKENRTE